MKFSIITPVFNNVSLIKEVIEYISKQENVNIEHIILDAMSTDGTREFLLSLPPSNARIVVSEKDSGIYDALNKGMKIATGEIIGILHSDDLLNNQHTLAHILTFFLKQNADIVYGDLVYVSRAETQKVLREWKSGVFSFNQLKYGWMPPHPAFFIKKECLVSSRLSYDLNYSISADYDFMLKCLLNKNFNIGYIPEFVSIMRMGGKSNKNLGNILKKMYEDFQIAKKYFSFPLITLLFKNLRKIKQIKIANG